MVFSSAPFLFIFLPVVFLVYYLIGRIFGEKAAPFKNALLTAASLIFYACGEPVFVLVMVGSVVLNYAAARVIAGKPGIAKPMLALAVILNLGLIGVFKYAAFAVTTVNQVGRLNLAVPQIALPIGISFFTFQVMSYVIDVYRNPETVQKSFWRLLLYVAFFPQLIAGPIVKYHDVLPYLGTRKENLPEISAGICRFIIGLGKKLFFANAMGEIADRMFNMGAAQLTAPAAWMGAICYCLQIFFDFSGYSDMAIGLGHMFGFTFQENFLYPYTADCMRDFWRRWHISLSTWFREYLYIPLGGNRKGKVRTQVNRLIVFFCTGLWHGASWNFVLWGLIHGAAITIEDVAGFGRRKDKKPWQRAVGWLYTMFIVCTAFVLFRADTLTEGAGYLRVMFSGAMPGVNGALSRAAIADSLTPWNIFLFLISLAACTPAARKLLGGRLADEKGVSAAGLAGAFVLLFLCVMNIASASYNPFIYFRF